MIAVIINIIKLVKDLQQQMRKNKGVANFTHFGSIPFIRSEYRQQLSQLQTQIIQVFKQKNLHNQLKINNPDLFHLTLSMLTLPHSSTRLKTQQALQEHKQSFINIFENTKFTTDRIKYFTYNNRNSANKNGPKCVNVIYLDIVKDEEHTKLTKLTDLLIRTLLKQDIISNQQLKDMYIQYDHNRNLFVNRDPHITLFRCENLYENQDFLHCFGQIQQIYLKRILQCDYIDISTRFDYDQTKFYTPLYRIFLDKKHEENTMKLQYKQKIQQGNKQQK